MDSCITGYSDDPSVYRRRIGILALQGGVGLHIRALRRIGIVGAPVRMPADLAQLDGLIIPGGESTTIGLLMERVALIDAIRRRYAEGMAIFGTCAGAILLARTITVGEGGDSGQVRLGLMDIAAHRNAYGRQVDSFETTVEWTPPATLSRSAEDDGSPMIGVFIRAPIITELGDGVEVLARSESKPVAIRQQRLLATSFHPELTSDTRLHRLFLEMINYRLSDPYSHRDTTMQP